MSTVFVGRQPIYDRDQRVYAYELLYRASEENACPSIGADSATSQVVLNSFLEIGLAQLVGEHLAFLNLGREFICQHRVPFPKDRVAIELLEDATGDEELMAALRRYADDGYLIALDDFVLSPDTQPLLEVADIVKLDVLDADPAAVATQAQDLRAHGVKLLAEKVETHEMHRHCHALGFDYFQGYFFARPDVVAGHELRANRLATLRLVAQLQDPATEVDELEGIIRQDPGLSYKLLRYINSAFFALPRKVDSIRQAVIYLGHRPIKTWATLLALSNIDDKPHELVTITLVRARMCEQLADSGQNGQTAFVIGLLSALDAMLDAPMAEIAGSLPLSSETLQALTEHDGPYGFLLTRVLAYEQGRWEELVGDPGLNPHALRDVYLEALAWAEAASAGLKG